MATTFTRSNSLDGPLPTTLDAAHREITSLRFDLKKAKSQLYQPIPTVNYDANTPSASIEDADNKCRTMQTALTATNQKLVLCKKELDDAVTKYRLLVRDTSKSRDADRDTHSATQDAIDSVRSEYEDRLRDHDREKAIMDKKLACVVHECAKKDEHIHRLKGNLRQSVRGKTEDFKVLVDAHGRQKAAHAKELSKVAGDLDQTIEDHVQAKAANDDLLDRVGEAVGNHNDIQSRLDKANSQIVLLHGQLDLHQRTIDALNLENQALKDKIAQQGARIGELESEIAQLRQQLAGHLSTVPTPVSSSAPAVRGDYEGRIRALQAQIDDLNTVIPRERADNARLRGEKEKLMEELASSKKALAAFKPTLERANAAKDTAVAAAAAANKRIELLLRDEADKEEAHRAERAALMARIEDLLREVDRLKDVNRSLSRQLEKSHGDKHLDLTNQQAQHGTELSALEAQIEHLKDLIKHHKDRNRDLEDDMKKLMQDRRGLESRIQKLEEQVAYEQRKIDDLHKLLDDMHRQAETAQEAMAVAQAEAARQRKRADDLQKQLALATSTISQLQSEIDRLKGRLASEETVTKTRSEAAPISSYLGSIMPTQPPPDDEKTKKLAAELERAKQKLDDMERQKDQKDQELEEALELVARQREKIVRMTEHTQTVVKQTLPQTLQDNIDALAPVLRQAQELAKSLQTDMVPQEEVTHSQSRTYHEQHREGAQVIRANVPVTK